jgi:hypothetical protein
MLGSTRHQSPGQRRVSEAMALWLAGQTWEFFVTPTFLYPRSGAASRCAAQGFMERISRSAGPDFSWYWVAERTRTGLWHLHALLECAGSLTVREVAACWRGERGRRGRIDVRRFNPALGGCRYVTKSIGLGEDEVDYELHLIRNSRE